MTDRWAAPTLWDWAITEVQQQPAVGGAALAALLAVLGLGYRLLAEAQRRSTLEQILTRAPSGSVIVQKKGVAGPAMWIWVGAGPPPTAHRCEYGIVVALPPQPAQPGLPRERSTR